MMSNDELQDFFTMDMPRVNQDPKIRSVLSGEPVFIFCVFKGKKGDVMTFIDSGANVQLALDGIPQKELDSVKLRDGPIPLGVASGKMAEAEAEWSSLISLQDGTFQCVRGLTMKTVTGQIPMMDLNPALDYIKKDCPNNQRIQNLKIPKVVGETVHMILGIPYQCNSFDQ